MKFRRGILLIISLFLLSCSSKNYVITDEYKGIILLDASLIIPNVEKVIVLQSDELFSNKELDEIRNQYIKLLNSELREEINSNSTFRQVVNVNLKPTFEFETIRVNFKEGTIPLEIPKFQLKTEDNTYILFLQNLYLNIFKERLDTSDPAKHYSVTPTPGNEATINKMKMYKYFLEFRLNYFIYDNTKNKIVSYGRMEKKDSYDLLKDPELMMRKAISELAKLVLEETPFVK